MKKKGAVELTHSSPSVCPRLKRAGSDLAKAVRSGDDALADAKRSEIVALDPSTAKAVADGDMKETAKAIRQTCGRKR